MEITELHSWPKGYHAALELQKILSSRVKLLNASHKRFSLVAGADVSSVRSQGRLWAATVVLRLPDFDLVEETHATLTTEFPYIPGLLSFREVPVLLEALRKLRSAPDAVVCDGQGLAHPRFFGLACHLGLWLNIPTIGCAKSRLVGDAPDVGPNPGDWQPLEYEHRTVGAVVRTRAKSKPLFVSPGHLMDTSTALEVVLSCCRGARLPEPTRLAHLAVNRFRENHSEGQQQEIF